jgi:hypothetical protein
VKIGGRIKMVRSVRCPQRANHLLVNRCGDIGPYKGKDTQSDCLPNVIRPGRYSRRDAAGLKLGEQLFLRDNVVVILQ